MNCFFFYFEKNIIWLLFPVLIFSVGRPNSKKWINSILNESYVTKNVYNFIHNTKNHVFCFISYLLLHEVIYHSSAWPKIFYHAIQIGSDSHPFIIYSFPETDNFLLYIIFIYKLDRIDICHCHNQHNCHVHLFLLLLLNIILWA